LGLDQLHPEYAENLAIVAWHNGDEFEFPEGMVRDGYYSITGYPTVWFDGWQSVVGGYQPSSYPYYVPVMDERVPYPSNFEVTFDIHNVDGTNLNVESTVEIKNGNNSENLAVFVVLTETDLESPGHENQNFVARNVYPGGMGMPVDFSTQTSVTWETPVTIEDDYEIGNCEIVVFIQNMDTKEIYQGYSKMAYEIVGYEEITLRADISVYPNPASGRININANAEIEQISIFNHVGQLVYKVEGSSNIMNLNTNGFEPGLYLFQVQTESGSYVKSVIIQ
jgi:hypothetical protein